MDDDSAATYCFLAHDMAGVGGGKIVHPKEAPPLGPKYSYMGHVLLPWLCTVINDQPNPRAPKLMIS